MKSSLVVGRLDREKLVVVRVKFVTGMVFHVGILYR